MNLIMSNDLDQLKELDLISLDLNCLDPFQEIELDQLISPLICACHLGRIEIVKYMMENERLDLDMASQTIGHTPLTAACLTGNFEIMKLLVQEGAEVNKPTNYHHTPFICCFERLQEESNTFENKLICFKMSQVLLENGADINWIVDKIKGYTLLMQLCAVKMPLSEKEKQITLEIIQYLIDNGADRSFKTVKGKTAFDLAEKHCLKDLI